MRYFPEAMKIFFVWLVLCLLSTCLLAQIHSAQLFLWEWKDLNATRKGLKQKQPVLWPAFVQLRKEAEEALLEGPFSVRQKTLSPASGNKQDYFSIGPYWWPDPEQPDGLPYIRRDGQTNPERDNDATDAGRFNKLKKNVTTLAHAYYFAKDERYAQKAAQLLRTWFLNPETRMNPHFEYAQAIPGRVEGRDIGIIDGTAMVEMTQAILLLTGSKHWPKQDHQRLQAWFSQFIDWLLTSEKGISEGKQHNNHGTWYDAQVAAYALFVGKPAIAREIVEKVAAQRLVTHIAPDGSQPYELARTRSWNYSIYNLKALLYLALIGDKTGTNLWAFEDAQGRSLQKAVKFLADYVPEGKSWPYPQITTLQKVDILPLLRYAANKYGLPFCDALLPFSNLPAPVFREILMFNGLVGEGCGQ